MDLPEGSQEKYILDQVALAELALTAGRNTMASREFPWTGDLTELAIQVGSAIDHLIQALHNIDDLARKEGQNIGEDVQVHADSPAAAEAAQWIRFTRSRGDGTRCADPDCLLTHTH